MPPRRPSKANTPDKASTADDRVPPCIRISTHGAVLDISVSPNAKRTEVVGLHDGALRVRLAAQPVEGQANAALLRWLSNELGVPLSRVEMLRGDTSRRKQVQVDQPADQVLAWLHGKLKS